MPRPERFDGVTRTAEAGLHERYTAAVVRIHHRGRCAFERAWGRTRAGAGGLSVDVDSRFDLASLTKIFVATAVLRAIDDGRLALDAPLAPLVPEWAHDERRAITPRMLLAHTSGLASGADYRTLLGADVVAELLARPVLDAPGARVVYSDLGFIALGVVLERVMRRPLAAALDELVAAARFRATAYRPRAAERARIPATEIDAWRGLVQGAVHDEKAWLMGGVAGHAGLFGTASDVARLCELYAGPLAGRPNALLATSTVQAAVAEQADDAVLRRGLGWALKTSDDNSCGRLASRATFGHTGFTGTCMWHDPEQDITIVMLTNAVHVARSDLRVLRAAVCDAAIAALAR